MAYALKVIKSPEDTEDILQELFISIWKRRIEFTIDGELSAYLYKAVRNLSLRYMDKNITRQDFLDKLSFHLKSTSLASFTAIELSELEAKVDQAIANLPAKMREIYILKRYENLSYRQIASQLNISESTVKNQVSNATKHIRADLGNLSVSSLFYVIFLLD